MKPHKKKLLAVTLTILLGVSLVTNVYLYLENEDFKGSSYREFDQSKKSLIQSIEKYIESLEEVTESEDINHQNLQSLSGSTLSSISQQSQITLTLYYNFTYEENVDRYQDDFGEFWEAGLTEISDVETKQELSQHIQELKRRFENFKQDLKEF